MSSKQTKVDPPVGTLALSSSINADSDTCSTTNTIAEQPQTKRPKIENLYKTDEQQIRGSNKTGSSSNGLSTQDVDQGGIDSKLLSSSLSSSAHSISTPSSLNNSPLSTPSSSRTSLSQLLNVQNIVNNIPTISSQKTILKEHVNDNTILACRTFIKSDEDSNDEVDRSCCVIPDTFKRGDKPKFAAPVLKDEDNNNSTQDMKEFEISLKKQCLCGVSERTLQKPFQSHYSTDLNGRKRIANLNEWPTNKLLQFLSNLQLLFEIYLKQNSKGYICGRIMDICDALIRNDNNLVDEIIVLAEYSNPYVQFLAARVLSSFMVIAKQEMDNDWLKKLVENLFSFDKLNNAAIQRIHFSLDIIKRIVEWRDIDLHPLEDEIVDIGGNACVSNLNNSLEAPNDAIALGHGSEAHAYLRFQSQHQSLDNNYFAVHFRSEQEHQNNRDECNLGSNGPSLLESNTPNESDDSPRIIESRNNIISNSSHVGYHNSHHEMFLSFQNHNTMHNQIDCQIVTLTDSESFDTTHLKCVTIKILENKWPALVKNMSTLIANHLDIQNSEDCILNFLQLWENIISVKANLSIIETLPFYTNLDKFELLLNQSLSCTIYKQMLCLFNEALCYGSTLALQDMLPDETCLLAHQIVRHVKDFRILESMPRRQPDNVVGFIGFKKRPVIYPTNSIQLHQIQEASTEVNDIIEMDKTILQKMVLLVLKSIAVTVKEIRSDSSDSSIDSSDYEAFQDMVLIERSIRDVLRKLEAYIKQSLEFHPECHFSKILIHLFDDQDDHLIEAMVCTLDVTAGISFRNNAFPELASMLNPVLTFLEFLKLISNSSDLLLDLLVSNETCFLLYLLRFLKYIRLNWIMFMQSCHDFGYGRATLDETMSVLIRLRLQISRLVSQQLYPYDISPVLRLLESCEGLYEGNELV